MGKYVCYCFEYTKEDIIGDVKKNNGKSFILERILMEKKHGNCNCKELNPKGL